MDKRYALPDILDYMYIQLARHTIDLQEPLPWWLQSGGYFRADSTDDTGCKSSALSWLRLAWWPDQGARYDPHVRPDR